MRNSTINLLFNIQSIVVFSIVWYKSGVWWHGFIGLLIHMIISGGLEGITRAMYKSEYKRSGYNRYPRYFYISTMIILAYYFFW
jgi:hypothetical protein